MNKIILTGATGFVGLNLASFILEHKLGNIERLSIRSQIVLPEGDAIIHLAGKAHDLKNASNPQEYFDVNANKTKELFDLFLKSDIKDFIYFSSVKAIADTVVGILDEDVKPDPKTPYGQSKLQAEEYILSKKLPEGKRVFILRPCMIHGPGNKGNLNLLYNVVKKGVPYPLGAFHNQRSFLSISNLNYIIKRLIMDPEIPGGTYNLADDVSLSTNEVIRIIAEVDGCKPRLWKISPTIIRAFAVIGDKLRLPISSERLKKLTESYVVSNEKIKKALQINKLPVSSEEGLFKTIQSFDSN
ncbi:NAD-dependent epimerase/dehydratase family protein [Pedobacter sp.]|jgi:nucleoside-diphosphate-sugar epimerase|uniref:NAD-dependent epimerase/dehydratase family protein n=1 Tax=Pedobacter sp. TaxID=1411316 RepID=UPI002C5935F5|nr:NAD-dependent epimerase/dehydratase family protein [Pedobacter sp.]HWW42293.1 NAD-dependent epimerase/dehydratase family protein [Pedobacter sp.]